VTYTKGVTYSQMGVLFVECSVFPCQHRPCWAQGVCFIKGKCWISSSQYCMLLLRCLTGSVFCNPAAELEKYIKIINDCVVYKTVDFVCILGNCSVAACTQVS
jgi:hypothetical protein